MVLLLTTAATAHEHHMDNIEEGHAISDDPIVRFVRSSAAKARETNVCLRTQYYGHTF